LWRAIDLLPIPVALSALGVLSVLGIDAQNPIVMFGVLEVVFGTDSVAGRLSIASKRQILFEDLIGRPPDFSLGAA
jgi:hypothetical protein